MELDSAQRIVLKALGRGVLRRSSHGWLVSTDAADQLVSDRVVRWLFGERYVETVPGVSTGPAEYRLTERGGRALDFAHTRDRAIRDGTALSGARLDADPVLLLLPATHSEELDWLLVVPLEPTDVQRHRRRLQAVGDVLGTSPDRFEFMQFADEVYAVPITPRLAELDLLPAPERTHLFLAEGLPDATDLGARRCTDRGVNYGMSWLQWFGGFDREAPLIIGSHLPVDVFRDLLGRADTLFASANDASAGVAKPAGLRSSG